MEGQGGAEGAQIVNKNNPNSFDPKQGRMCPAETQMAEWQPRVSCRNLAAMPEGCGRTALHVDGTSGLADLFAPHHQGASHILLHLQ